MSAAADELERHLAAFRRGAVDLVEERELAQRLRERLERRQGLRVKFGMDPSSPDLHVGHAIPLLKLRDLQRLGHTIVLIVGDATARVGDPSGRNKLRPQLSRAEVEANLKTYTAQAGRVLDMSAAEVRHNSEWFDSMGFEDVLALAARMTVARMLERDTFNERVRSGEPIGIHELLYPLMQGWDSVQVRADVELGGTDQLFNLLVGRRLQEPMGQPPQVCLTTPLVNGLDGRKMSKSYGNAVGLTDSPKDMTFALMRLTDESMGTWFTQLTRLSEEDVEALLSGHPLEAKARLAEEVTRTFWGEAAAREAREAFEREVRGGELPEDLPELAWPPGEESLPLANLLRALGLVKSTSEARRLVQQGAVRVAGELATDAMGMVERPGGALLLQVGKKRAARVR